MARCIDGKMTNLSFQTHQFKYEKNAFFWYTNLIYTNLVNTHKNQIKNFSFHYFSPLTSAGKGVPQIAEMDAEKVSRTLRGWTQNENSAKICEISGKQTPLGIKICENQRNQRETNPVRLRGWTQKENSAKIRGKQILSEKKLSKDSRDQRFWD